MQRRRVQKYLLWFRIETQSVQVSRAGLAGVRATCEMNTSFSVAKCHAVSRLHTDSIPPVHTALTGYFLEKRAERSACLWMTRRLFIVEAPLEGEWCEAMRPYRMGRLSVFALPHAWYILVYFFVS